MDSFDQHFEVINDFISGHKGTAEDARRALSEIKKMPYRWREADTIEKALNEALKER